MKNEVLVDFKTQEIYVDRDGVTCSFTKELLKKTPENVSLDEIASLSWVAGRVNGTYVGLESGATILYGEDKYNDWVQPYIDIWQSEKDQLEQRRQEAEAEYNSFPNVKARKLDELNAAHKTAESDAHILSSLGFEIDANDRANRDVEGILRTIGDGTTMFCDYNNEFHELNKAQVETLQVEIIQNAQALYAQKWAYRTQVEAAENVDELDAIEFTFSQMRF